MKKKIVKENSMMIVKKKYMEKWSYIKAIYHRKSNPTSVNVRQKEIEIIKG